MKRILFFLSGMVVSLLLILLTLALTFQDGLVGIAFILLREDQTIRAEKYSEKAFHSITIGADETSVLKKIGQPLEWEANGDLKYGFWTKACCSGSSSVRILGFKDHRVISKVSEYDWD